MKGLTGELMTGTSMGRLIANSMARRVARALRITPGIRRLVMVDAAVAGAATPSVPAAPAMRHPHSGPREGDHIPGGWATPIGRQTRAVSGLAALVTVLAVPLPGTPASAEGAVRATDVFAIESPGSARLTWTYDGYAPSGWRVTTSTGQAYDPPYAGQYTGDRWAATVHGVPNGVPVSFRVIAVDLEESPPSEPSNTVTPRAPRRTNTWAAARPMRIDRTHARAMRLRNGKVLVLGGYSNVGDLQHTKRTAELYDPRTNRWSPARPMPDQLGGFSATLLRNGRVLVAGGFMDDNNEVPTAEIYDPARNRWSAAAPMPHPRSMHTATLLKDGRVLAAGGVDGSRTRRTADVYDPRRNRWSRTGNMTSPRAYATATRLRNGDVLVAGGSFNGPASRTAQVYHVATGRWSRTGSMATARDFYSGATLARLPDGKVLVAGGDDASDARARPVRTAELYDPTTARWTATGSLHVGRDTSSRLVTLSRGRVLVVGGTDGITGLPYAEVYDHATGRWHRANDMTELRSQPIAVRLADGRVLVAGGEEAFQNESSTAVRTAEIFTPR
jgi:hypothetical protein